MEGGPAVVGVDAPLAEAVVAPAAQAVPQNLRLAVRDAATDPLADAVEHAAGVVPLGVDEGAVEVEQPALVAVAVDADAVVSGHRRP